MNNLESMRNCLGGCARLVKLAPLVDVKVANISIILMNIHEYVGH